MFQQIILLWLDSADEIDLLGSNGNGKSNSKIYFYV